MSKIKTIQAILLLMMIVLATLIERPRHQNVCVDLSSVSQLELSDTPEHDHSPHLLIYIPALTNVFASEIHQQRFYFSHEIFHITQLLSSFRIALPPPVVISYS